MLGNVKQISTRIYEFMLRKNIMLILLYFVIYNCILVWSFNSCTYFKLDKTKVKAIIVCVVHHNIPQITLYYF